MKSDLNFDYGHVRFGCTVEPETPWINSAVLLYQSLLQNGGKWSKCEFLILVPTIHELSKFEFIHDNLMVKFCSRQSMPYLNKANHLLEEKTSQVTHLVLLDHDTIIRNLQNLENYLNLKVMARVNNKDTLESIINPEYKIPINKMTNDSWNEIPYFNSGVIIFPVSTWGKMYTQWVSCTHYLFQFYHKPLAEQVAFAVGLYLNKYQWGELPRSYNHTNWGELLPEASIIHYNNHDKENITVKSIYMRDYNELINYLNNTDNRFWKLFGSDVRQLINNDSFSLSAEIENWILKIMN